MAAVPLAAVPFLPDLAVEKILLDIPSPADLVRAALTSKRWLEVASSPVFLGKHRTRYPSLPLLGLYVPQVLAGGAPSFQVAASVRSDRALARFVHRGDFYLTGLDGGLDWWLLDCRGGRLLLATGERRVVYNPVSGRRVADFVHPQNDALTDTIAECLLQGDGHGDDAGPSFRVVSVQHHRRDSTVRAVEYSSSTREWQFHQWADNIGRPQDYQAMQAGRLIFWRYKESLTLMLDTTTMDFSIKVLPCAFFPRCKYAIGDTEDGSCCLVGLVGSMHDLQLHLWLLQDNGDAKSREPDKKVPMIRELVDNARLCQVHAVINGLALLCWDQRKQFAIDLEKMCLQAKFECTALGYPLHMPWPPAVLVKTGGAETNGVVDVKEQNCFAIEETEMNAYTANAAESPPPCTVEAPEVYDLKDLKDEKKVCSDSKGEVTIVVCKPGLDIVEAAASIVTTAGLKSVEGSQRQTNGEDHELSVLNTEHAHSLPLITTNPNSDTLINHVDLAAKRLNDLACSEMNNMVDIHESQVVHGSQMVSTSNLDHGGERINCNQNVVQRTEMVQSIEMAPNNYTAEAAPPTSSRCSSGMGHDAEMSHFNQIDTHAEMVRYIKMTWFNDISEAPPTTLIDDSETVQNTEITTVDDTAEAPVDTSTAGNEIVQNIEIVIVGNTVEAPQTTSTNESEITRGVQMTIVNEISESPLNISTDDRETDPSSKTAHGGERIHDTEMARYNATAEGAQPVTSRRRRLKSSVWEHFTAKVGSDGCTRACCNHCKRTFAGSRCAGTSHLKRHIALGSCPMMKLGSTPSAGGTEIGSAGTAEKPSKRHCTYGAGTADKPSKRHSERNCYDAFNQDLCSSFLTNMIILHDYPLDIVKQPAFITFVMDLQPSFKVLDMNTMEAEVYAVYQRERDNILKEFGAIPGKISLTAGLWTTSQTFGFISLAGQFIDSQWKLRRRMLNFIMVTQPCKENVVSEATSKSLPQWNMKDKLFTITVDENCLSHDVYNINLRDHLSKKNIPMPGGNFSVVRCYARILNEAAHDVIASIQSVIDKIRESIKFIRSCVINEDMFSSIAQQLQVSSTKILCLDITTQWNTTYLMLLVALDYKHALTMLETCDGYYNQAPSAKEWKKVEVACKYLKLLYDSAHKIIATEDPTANIFFHDAWRFQQEFSTATALQDPISSSITKDMHERFDKYWKDCNVVLAIAVVIDPRFKMKIIEFSYSKIYGVKAAEYVKRVDDAVHELYKEYATEPLPLSTDNTEKGGTNVVPSRGSNIPSKSPSTDLNFEIYLSEITHECLKSELDCYLEEALVPRMPEFDILRWWKLNTLKYPRLSKMARDVLAIPLSMACNRSSIFSAGTEVKMLNDYHSSLRPEIVEALFCAKDWLQTSPHVPTSHSSASA